ncbi:MULTISPECIES: lytic transglycosylase domain-containing protein [Rhodonellum]|nr:MULTISPECIES: lytic transglycosylase domain-containing protein [Rhodonellum]MDO9552240.1 transglycosylase SLT domain-containing protein [Rhodonellum sp.]
MKKFIPPFFLSLILGLIGGPLVHGQELFLVNNVSIEEETISPKYQFDYIPDFTYQQVATRVGAMETEMSFNLNERIFSFINYFAVRNREYSRMVLERKDIFFPLFEETLARHDMPDDIKFLAIIESGLNPKAKSRVGAMGLWQFMPATGRMYNLHANSDIDDRMDPEMATDAAAKYLKSLYRMFGDWEVALAAYNCGPGNVRKAIRKSGGKKTFEGIYDHLPKETRSYVPQFQAMMYVLRYAEEHNLVLEHPSYPIAYDKILFNQELDLEKFAKMTDICIADLEQLNPSIQNRLIPASHQNLALRIPKSKSDYVTENLNEFSNAVKLTSDRYVALRQPNSINTNKPAVAATTNVSTANQERIPYKVKSGDALGKIAQKHGTTVDNIKSWNNLTSNTIKIGQTLYIFASQKSPDQNIAQNTQRSPSSIENPKVYIVQPGDSLWLISKKLNGIHIDQIKKLNNLNSNQIKPGQKLIIG